MRGSLDYFESERLIDPLFNDMFIRVFGGKHSANVTGSFVGAILREAGLDDLGDISGIRSEESVVTGTIDSRGARFDVLITTEARLIDLESQRYPENVERRSLFYAGKLIHSSLSTGQSFKNVPNVVVITILDAAPMFPGTDGYLHACKMRWEDPGDRKDTFEGLAFVVVELEKIRKRYTELEDNVLTNELLSWLYLLSKGFSDKLEVESIMAKFPTVEEFAALYGVALDDPQLMMKYDLYEESERELQNRREYFERLEREGAERGFKEGVERGYEQGMQQGLEQGMQQGLEQGMQQGLEQGIEQGIQQGRAQAVDDLVAKLLELGVDKEVIAQVQSKK